jgi:hypothetical protein
MLRVFCQLGSETTKITSTMIGRKIGTKLRIQTDICPSKFKFKWKFKNKLPYPKIYCPSISSASHSLLKI